MRQRDRIAQIDRRIAKAEATAHATILRAFDRVIQTLQREATEYRIYLDRQRRKVRR